jgi:acetate kinase
VRVLTVNPGSTSLKVHLVEAGSAADLGGDLGEALRRAGPFEVAAVRVVHGGMALRRHAVVDDAVVAQVDAATDLAPLHNRQSLAAIHALRAAGSQRPIVACLDTAFHAGMPEAARTYPLPREWRDRWGLERLGFHGLSHEWAARHGAELLGATAEDLRLVTCHLGGGASLAAVQRGVSVDTTMGFTPLEGLMMATRSGSVDPGMLLWLQSTGRLSVAETGGGLEHGSGLLGIAGSDDMRSLVERGDGAAGLAVDMYVHRLAAGIAAMAAAMTGVDGIVFTGGVGAHSAAVRGAACTRLGFIGVELGAEANTAARPDHRISTHGSRVGVCVVESREELVMAGIAEQAASA